MINPGEIIVIDGRPYEAVATEEFACGDCALFGMDGCPECWNEMTDLHFVALSLEGVA